MKQFVLILSIYLLCVACGGATSLEAGDSVDTSLSSQSLADGIVGVWHSEKEVELYFHGVVGPEGVGTVTYAGFGLLIEFKADGSASSYLLDSLDSTKVVFANSGTYSIEDDLLTVSLVSFGETSTLVSLENGVLTLTDQDDGEEWPYLPSELSVSDLELPEGGFDEEALLAHAVQ